MRSLKLITDEMKEIGFFGNFAAHARGKGTVRDVIDVAGVHGRERSPLHGHATSYKKPPRASRDPLRHELRSIAGRGHARDLAREDLGAKERRIGAATDPCTTIKRMVSVTHSRKSSQSSEIRVVLQQAPSTFSAALLHLAALSGPNAFVEAMNGSQGATISTKPNIVYIMLDDAGYNDFFDSTITPPNIDTMASNGILFDAFYTSPVCSPTRVSVVSGSTPVSHGVFNVFWSGDSL